MTKFTSLTCCHATLPLYAILSAVGNGPAHLTFCPKRHSWALAWLAANGAIVSECKPDDHDVLCRKLLELCLELPRQDDLTQASPFYQRGTTFQKRVWALIGAIPFGETRTYGELARKLGNIRLSRAVGQACNANPLALYIPCHRIVSATGPGGFAGGGNLKEVLLEFEHTK